VRSGDTLRASAAAAFFVDRPLLRTPCLEDERDDAALHVDLAADCILRLCIASDGVLPADAPFLAGVTAKATPATAIPAARSSHLVYCFANMAEL
jgi:hypothetical protein